MTFIKDTADPGFAVTMQVTGEHEEALQKAKKQKAAGQPGH